MTLIADIRRNALDDGPGIRSTVFFKGCVLDCVWCQNPETLASTAELQRDPGSCIGCEECERRCPHGAVTIHKGGRIYRREACELCGTCIEGCAPGALRQVGRSYTVDELVELLLQDELFYRNSGGGVTLSGGEPTMHLAYLVELAKRLRDRGVHLLLETCGLYNTKRFEAGLLPLLDMVYFDLKLADPDLHRRFTGQDNGQILDNLRRLCRLVPNRILARVPLVPTITATHENLRKIGELLVECGQSQLALLPYNPLWIDKRRELGRPLTFKVNRFMTTRELERCRAVLEGQGLAVV